MDYFQYVVVSVAVVFGPPGIWYVGNAVADIVKFFRKERIEDAARRTQAKEGTQP